MKFKTIINKTKIMKRKFAFVFALATFFATIGYAQNRKAMRDSLTRQYQIINRAFQREKDSLYAAKPRLRIDSLKTGDSLRVSIEILGHALVTKIDTVLWLPVTVLKQKDQHIVQMKLPINDGVENLYLTYRLNDKWKGRMWVSSEAVLPAEISKFNKRNSATYEVYTWEGNVMNDFIGNRIIRIYTW